ncbi:MAG: FliH/SctL family protein [Aquificaceae bacterium]
MEKPMYKGEFKPLFHEHGKAENPQEEKQNIQNPCEEIELKYRYELESFVEKIDQLKTNIESLEKEKEEILKKNVKLIEELERREKAEVLIDKISNKLLEVFADTKIKLKKEFVNIILDVLKRILIADILPKEEALTKALSFAFESGIELNGEINLYVNPEDFQLVEEYVKKLSSPLQLNLLTKKELERGEFVIETQKLWIERRYEDLLLDILRDIRDERSL